MRHKLHSFFYPQQFKKLSRFTTKTALSFHNQKAIFLSPRAIAPPPQRGLKIKKQLFWLFTGFVPFEGAAQRAGRCVLGY